MKGNKIWAGRKHSEEAKAKIVAATIGRKRPEGAGIPRVQIEVFDMETGIKTIYPSMSEAGKALGVPPGSIGSYFYRNTQKPFKGKYLFKKLTLGS